MDDDLAIPAQPAGGPLGATSPDGAEPVDGPVAAPVNGPVDGPVEPGGPDAVDAVRDIAEVPAIELISTAALHLLSAAAVKCGLGHDEPDDATPGVASHVDLDEARKLITALAGLVTAAAPEVGNQHARLLRDGLRQVQLAFREASPVPDPPGQGPGERLTGPVS